MQTSRYIIDSAAAPDPVVPAARGLKIAAVLADSIATGFALAFALILTWPTPIGVLLGMLILAAANAAGGFIAARTYPNTP